MILWQGWEMTIKLTQAIKHNPAAQGNLQLGREGGQNTPFLVLET